jgi:hypothetical protein
MRQNFKITTLKAVTLFLFGASVAGLAQNRNTDQARPAVTSPGYRILNDDMRSCGRANYPNSPAVSPFCSPETSFTVINDQMRLAAEQSATYQELVRRQGIRAAQEEAIRSREAWCCEQRHEEAATQANPDAPDQSELLKNSKDRDFILHNLRTMYVDARDARYFDSRQLKAALGRNKDFEKLNIRMVDDPRVADAVLKVSYTFAWDFPFELTHQNTTIVLLSGKGEGPFSGPLGAADVARNFVNAARPWREAKKDKSNH